MVSIFSAPISSSVIYSVVSFMERDVLPSFTSFYVREVCFDFKRFSFTTSVASLQVSSEVEVIASTQSVDSRDSSTKDSASGNATAFPPSAVPG